METFRPYIWLRKQGNQYNEFYYISIPAGYRVATGLQGPTDDTTSGVRTYKFNVESYAPASASIVDANVGDHSQPATITKISFQVMDVTDSGKPVKKGETDIDYQSGDTTS